MREPWIASPRDRLRLVLSAFGLNKRQRENVERLAEDLARQRTLTLDQARGAIPCPACGWPISDCVCIRRAAANSQARPE